jgi:hypothetical protein
MLVINKNINDAIAIYAQLVSKDSTNISLIAEYSYALALGGIYDAALSHLDRLWNNDKKTPEVFYFISQVFTLMGDDDLAIEFCNEDAKSSAPGWISDKANELRELFGRKNPLSTIKNYQELITTFKHANKLASQNSNLQSIALFRDIINQYPNEYIPFIGYSIPLEKLGMLEKSVQSIEKAISLIQDNPDKKDVKQTLDNRLTVLRNKKTSTLTTKNLGLKSNQEEIMSPKMLIYAGAMLGGGYTSINCRLGYFLTESMNGSIDLGLSGSSGTTTTNIGFSMYGRQKTLVYGAGLTCNLGSSTLIYAKISVGLSFLNKKHTASFDIFLNGNTPLTKGNPTTFTMSIGRSIYFGNRK